MVIAVRTEEIDGDLVVVKEARTDGDVARLGREATMLRRGRHPGVVELLAVEARSIRLRHAGTALSRLRPLSLDHAAGIMSAVADIVHALHRQGVVHGDLDADHVVIDERGRPRLCGFGLATGYTPEGAAGDVAALGRLLSSLLRDSEGAPRVRAGGGLWSRSWRRQARRELEAVAARALRSDADQRPTARQLSKAVHAAVPAQHLPGPAVSARPPGHGTFAEIPSDVDPTADLAWTAEDLSFLASHHDDAEQDLEPVAAPSPVSGLERASIAVQPEPEDDRAGPTIPLPDVRARASRERVVRRPAVRVAGLAAILVLGIVAGVAVARAIAPFGPDDPGDAAGDAVSGPDTTAPLPRATPPTWPRHCEVPGAPGPDVDGDGCPEAIDLDGRRATVGSVSVVLGTEGDEVVLGDWNCDAVATPALLRPSTGEVFVFLRWSFDDPLEVEATAVVPDATGISVGDGACPSPAVATPGETVDVAVPR